jgi:hypothetical protein
LTDGDNLIIKNKMIIFEKKTKIVVKIDGKVSGHIKQVSDGWQYCPKGSKKFTGLIYKTDVECMNSLY